jgi:transcriptional regulator with XRE-family HTH domain
MSNSEIFDIAFENKQKKIEQENEKVEAKLTELQNNQITTKTQAKSFTDQLKELTIDAIVSFQKWQDMAEFCFINKIWNFYDEYKNWEEYCQGELNLSALNISIDKRLEAVKNFIHKGFSRRQIAAVIGVRHSTINNDTKQLNLSSEKKPPVLTDIKIEALRQNIQGVNQEQIANNLNKQQSQISSYIKDAKNEISKTDDIDEVLKELKTAKDVTAIVEKLPVENKPNTIINDELTQYLLITVANFIFINTNIKNKNELNENISEIIENLLDQLADFFEFLSKNKNFSIEKNKKIVLNNTINMIKEKSSN